MIMHATSVSPQRGYILITMLVTLSLLAAIALLINNNSSSNVALVRGEQSAMQADYLVEAGLRHAMWAADASNCSGYILPLTPFDTHSYSASYSPDNGSPVDIIVDARTVGGVTRSQVRHRMPIYQSAIMLNLQPGPDTGKDTHIYEWKPTWNFGTDPNLVASGVAFSKERALLQFDVTGVPGGAKVVSATLSLNSNSKSWPSTTVEVSRITVPWVAGTANGTVGAGANWTEADAGVSWTTDGGDLDPTTVATAHTPGDVGWVHWDVTQLVNVWVSGAAKNHGLALSVPTAFEGVQFDSSEAALATDRPRLTVVYACECGTSCTTGVCVAGDYLDTFSKDSFKGSDGSLAWSDDWIEQDSAGLGVSSGKLQVLGGELRLNGTPVSLSDPSLARQIDLSGHQSATLSFSYRTGSGVEAGEDSALVEVSADGGATWSLLEDFIALGGSATGSRSYDISAYLSVDTQIRFRINAAYGGPDEYFYVDDVNITASCDPPVPTSCSADYLADNKVSEFSTSAYGSDTPKDLTYVPEGVTFNGAMAPSGGAWLSVDSSNDRFYMSDMAGTLLTSLPGSSSMGGVAYVKGGVWAGHVAVADFGVDEIRYYDNAGSLAGSFSLSGYMVGTPSGAAYVDATVSGIYDAHLAISDRSKSLVYIADQNGILKTTLDLSAYAAGPTDVAHMPGSDKLLVLDETRMAYVVAFDGTKMGEYDTTGFGTAGSVGLAINPVTCDHVISDDSVDKVIALNTGSPPPDPPGPPAGPMILFSEIDTDIRGSDANNFGDSQALRAGRDNGGPLLYPLLRFDVSGIEPGTVIATAKLRLYQFDHNRTGSFDLGAHRVDEEWTEMGANWQKSDGTTFWVGGQGGTYTSPAVSTTSISIGSYGWYEWDITSLVQEWVDGVSVNHGVQMVFVSVNAGRNVSFASSEHPTESQRPELMITF